MTEEIKKIIDTYEEKGDFTYTTITNDQIEEAQKALGVKIPEQYLDFLRTYGHGGIGGIEIIGIGKSGKMLFLDETLKYREYGLDEKLILRRKPVPARTGFSLWSSGKTICYNRSVLAEYTLCYNKSLSI